MKIYQLRKKFFYGLIIFVFFTLLYIYRLSVSYNIDNDFGRDIIDIISITKGHFMLIGPGSSIGIQTGPYYYYLFTPIVFFTHADITAILIFNALLFSISLTYFFITAVSELSIFKATLTTISLGVLPLYIQSARSPGNAYSYVPFLSAILTIITFTKIESKKKLLLVGFLTGFIINFHYANVITLSIIIVTLFVVLKNKISVVYFLSGVVIAFIPLLIFEIRHKFVMTKNLLTNKFYTNFTDNNKLAAANAAKKNSFANLIFLINSLKPSIAANPVIIFLVSFFVWLQKRNTICFLLISCTIISLLSIAVLFHGQFSTYYLYPIGLILIFGFVLLLARSSYFLLLILFIVFELVNFPKDLYLKSARPQSKFSVPVNYIIKNHILTKDKFAVLEIRSGLDHVLNGYEYRLFFEKNNYYPQEVTNYNTADQLLVFSEIKNFNLKNWNNWELTQFSPTHNFITKKYTLPNVTIYSLVKK